MPEPPQMPDTRDPRDLDRRIRDLVAHAIADAPAPPDLDPATVPLAEPATPGHRRWWIGGGAAVLAAAALITAFVLVGDSDKSVTTPATDPIPVPTTTAGPPAPTTTPPPAPDAGRVLTAGPGGVFEHRGTASRRLTTEPMVTALEWGDGRVIVQRRSGDGAGQGWTDADTAPLVLAEDGSLTPLFDTVDWDGGVVLHDIEVVDGRQLLLFSLQVAMNVNPENADETLYVVDLETHIRTEVAAGIGGWEFGTGRLHLATNGLIVGEGSSGPTTEAVVLAVPGSPAEALLASPSSAPLGWEPSTDCADCQRAYTVAPDGRSVAWLEGDDLVTAEIDGLTAGPEQRYPLDPAVPTANVRDLDFDRTSVVLSYWLSDPLPAPVLVHADDPSAPPTVVEGQAAALSPAGTVPAATSDPSPETTAVDSSVEPPVDTGPVCGFDPQTSAVVDHLGDVPPAFAGGPPWVFQGETNYDPCAALSYALIETQGGTGSSPKQVMLFHEGEYVGTATECAFGFVAMYEATNDSVTFEYRWPREGDPNAAPSGVATATFRWDDATDAVQQEGELPQELLDVSGCAN
jgi:LppP/LprE lipoprotein